jgi:thiol:disulfide interchange protein DsbC
MIKSVVKSALVGSLLLTSTYAKEASLPTKQFENINLFKNKNIPFSVKEAYDRGDFFHLKAKIGGNIQELFLSKDKKYLLFGKAFDANSGDELIIPVDMNSYAKDAGMTYGTGKEEFFVFTDPECPYCKKFESFWPKVAKNVKLNVFFFPLSFHKNAKDMSLYVMSQDPKKRYDALKNLTAESKELKDAKYTTSELKELEKRLEVQMKIANDLGVRGTPAVYDKDGRPVQWPAILGKHGVSVR